MRKAVFSMIAAVAMLFIVSVQAEGAIWSGPRYRGPFVTQSDCEYTRSVWESSMGDDIDPAPCCTYYPSGAPKPGGMGGPGWYFIYYVNVE